MFLVIAVRLTGKHQSSKLNRDSEVALGFVKLVSIVGRLIYIILVLPPSSQKSHSEPKETEKNDNGNTELHQKGRENLFNGSALIKLWIWSYYYQYLQDRGSH